MVMYPSFKISSMSSFPDYTVVSFPQSLLPPPNPRLAHQPPLPHLNRFLSHLGIYHLHPSISSLPHEYPNVSNTVPYFFSLPLDPILASREISSKVSLRCVAGASCCHHGSLLIPPSPCNPSPLRIIRR